MTYGVEAIIPLEVGFPTLWSQAFVSRNNDQTLAKDLDLVEERRELASIQLTKYQGELSRQHQKKVRTRGFQVGDMVLCKVVGNTREHTDGMLGPNWEGPYKVVAVGGTRAYRLQDMDEKDVSRPWNVLNLKKYYY